MQVIEIKELKPDYEVIELSSTQLESFVNPVKYPEQPKEEQWETFSIGSMIEKVAMQTMMYGVEAGKMCAKHILENWDHHSKWSLDSEENKQIRWIYDSLEKYPELLIDYANIKPDIVNHRYYFKFDVSKYRILFSGEVDVGLGECLLMDIKSAKKRWAKEIELGKRQWIYYIAMHCYVVNNMNTKIPFEYLVFVKNMKPVLDIRRCEMTGNEAMEILKKDIMEYCKAVHNGVANTEN